MSQSSVIGAAILIGFFVFITMRNRLKLYRKVIGL